MRKIHTYYLFIVAFAALMLFTACAEVDLCEDHDGSHSTAVRYSYNWNGSDGDSPAKMYAVAHRIINDWQRAAIVPASESSDTFAILPGEYKFLTIPAQHNAFNMDEIIASIENPMVNGRMQDKSISYELYSARQLANSSTDGDYSGDAKTYIAIDPQPFYFDSVAVVNVNNGVANVRFAPKPITQCVDVQFYINAKTTNPVDSVFAELSGIPVSMEIGSRFVSEKTASAFLRLSFSLANLEQEEGKIINVLQCNSQINVPTVLNSASSSETTGPGLLTVGVYTSEDTPEGKIVHCTVETRNLYSILEKAKLNVYADDLEHIVRNGESGKIDVKVPFTIYK